MEAESKSSRSRFLSKSKWGKVFKEDESKAASTPDAAGRKDSFKLNDDLAAFLRPSTDKARPKIDVDAVQRWPNAHDVIRTASGHEIPQSNNNAQTSPGRNVNGYRKRRRREGLNVAFARTAPEVIGSGGDEADDPPSEVGRRKAVMSRSVSDRRPSAFENGMPWPGSQQQQQQRGASAGRGPVLPPVGRPTMEQQRQDFNPPPMRRAQTSHNEVSPAMQARQAPPRREPPPPRIGISRTPTGFDSPEPQEFIDVGDDDGEFQLPKARSSFETRLGGQHYGSSLEVRKRQQDMTAGEGNAFRRASRIMADTREEGGDVEEELINLPAEIAALAVDERDAPPTQHTTSLDPSSASANRSPFADPRYLGRHDREPSPSGRQQAPPQQSNYPRPHPSESPTAASAEHSPSSREHNQPSANIAGSRLQPYDNAQHPPSTYGHARTPSGNNSLYNSQIRQQNPSPYARGPSPNDYFAQPVQTRSTQSPPDRLRQDNPNRPSSSGSTTSISRPPPSPQPGMGFNPAGDAALADFASRVAHMSGVFRLTAEKEQPSDWCSPNGWLRAALWWYLRGKTGLESLLQQRSRSPQNPPREMLTQAHVDLAKAWWILSEPLEHYAPSESPAHSPHDPTAALRYGCSNLRNYLKTLCASVGRSNIMPPHQSLIQGQDTSIWLRYPRFAPNAALILKGATGNSDNNQQARSGVTSLEAVPLGDSREVFSYARFFVEVYVSTDEAETDRVMLPCVLSLLRGSHDFQNSIMIASQSELVSVRIGPKGSHSSEVSWHDVSWRANSSTIAVHLPHGFDMTVRLHENDFRTLYSMVEYTRKIDHGLRPEANETFKHEARLAELQYADSSNPNAFPADKLRGCLAYVYERHVEEADASSVRKKHRGFRLHLFTDPAHKTLYSVGCEIGRKSPLFFEFITDASANGTAAMVIRVREESRQSRVLLVFRDVHARQDFYDVLNGLDVEASEVIAAKTPLTSMRISPSTRAANDAADDGDAGPLARLEWQRVGVTNSQPKHADSRIGSTVESEKLRILARHAHGCITDRLNLGKGELLFRLPCVTNHSSSIPTIHLLREPQPDLSLSIDARHTSSAEQSALASTLDLAQTQPTLRVFTFPSHADLHAFQAAITGFSVRYEGQAATLAISRRMMVVPIHHKWTASNVRVQIVANAHNTVKHLLAFMEDFPQADALCFQIRSTDTYESIKGDAKGKKWAVKLVEAKFSLPAVSSEKEKGEVVDEATRIRRRFVNLEGLDYALEHDDITVGFETEEARDMFSAALPAATTVGRKITLKRRI